MALRRTQAILSHIAPIENPERTFIYPTPTSSPQEKRDDDVVICSAIRTPIGKANRGSFKDTHWTELLAVVLSETITRTKIDPKQIQDIVVGTVLPPGGGATQARMAQFLAGLPYEISLTTVNRQCSSGLQAFANIAGEIKTGAIDVGIAAGVESMSNHTMMSAVGELNNRIFEDSNQLAQECLIPMGQTSENVAEKYGISRKLQDEFALRSQEKAVKAQKEGLFDQEIVPVSTKILTPEGETKKITVTKDDGPRKSTIEDLIKLKPAFKKDGTTTAGNSSQVSDGAAAVLVATRKRAKELNLPILGRFISYAVAGVPPSIMGIGPAEAIPLALKKAGLTVGDIDTFEINEAFASQARYSAEKLKIDLEKVNPLGGAIALGHPLGCTGARQIATLLHHMRRNKQRFGVVSMCIGTGMGAAGVFEAEY
eukprot:TRINITY_DN116_c0_g1_i1.p1 TRINITY_DN116_c0_g1~~TRINITY_DN116_c0_g1_i1.p1  ORF type:complete len:427 (-),score=90.08 TRINITY_DN116_c0_g1_i1:62-1342(-)